MLACRLDKKIETKFQHRKEALKVSKAHGDKQLDVRALVALGRAYLENEQFQIAVDTFEEALSIAKEQGNKYQETQALFG